jgi:hypothetical protein
MLGGYIGFAFVDQATGEPKNIDCLLSFSIDNANTESGRMRLLSNITKQTGLNFKEQEQTFTIWQCSGVPSTQPVN